MSTNNWQQEPDINLNNWQQELGSTSLLHLNKTHI